MSDRLPTIEELSPEQRRAMLRTLLERRAAQPRAVPASFAQRRLWFLHRLDAASPLYNIPSHMRMSGELDVARLQRCLEEIASRHDTLRTTFAVHDGELMQVIAPGATIDLPVVDLSNVPAPCRPDEARRCIALEIDQPFDLAAGPLLRCRLLRLDPREHLLVLTIHHIIADGWSMAVLTREIAVLYGALADGRPSPLPPLAVQYADFSIWQRGALQGKALADDLAYWRQRLDGAATLGLPTDRPRPGVQRFCGAHVPIVLPAELSAGLQALGERHGATLFMVLLAGFKVWLQRICGQDDIVVGAPVAGRSRAELEDLIGFFANMLVLRTEIRGDQTFLEALARVRDTALHAYAHQDVPFEKLVEELQPQRDLSRNPLFQVAFALQNATPAPPLELPGLRLSPPAFPGFSLGELEIETTTARFDLELHLWQPPQGVCGTVVYNTDLFDRATVQRWVGHYTTLLAAIVADPRQTVANLPLLDPGQRRRMLVAWNDVASRYPSRACIHQLFEEQAEKRPDEVAVVCGAEQVEYAELNRRANRLAHYLIGLGLQPEANVGVCLERQVDLIVALLAILKCGAAYVPLDSAYPRSRLGFILEDAGCQVLLTHSAMADLLPEQGAGGARRVLLDQQPDLAAGPDCNPQRPLHADPLAYIVYTSGSTGQPKGVCVEHRAVVRLVRNTNYVQLEPGDVIAQASNASFDAATFEIWGALLNGAKLVIVPREEALDPAALARTLRAHCVTVLFVTTALFNQIAREKPTAFGRLRYLLFGGELVDPAAVRVVLQTRPPAHLLHVYGPTESTTFTTWYEVKLPWGPAVPQAGRTEALREPGGDEGRGMPEVAPGLPADLEADLPTVPIGRAIGNTRIYVLDRHQQPVPVGIPGELYIGGDGLARGYLHRPELNAERFIPSPLAEEAGRLYRTGDLVRWTPDGQIEFLGRNDAQVKIRGFRIELGEIESVLSTHEAVRDAVVLARRDASGTRLVAYVVPADGPAGQPAAWDALRSYLRARLPEYMVPSAFVALEALPLNPNGKVDRAALPEAAPQRQIAAEFVAPSGALEQTIADAWRQVLGLARVGTRDNFFDLGGHSLALVQVHGLLSGRLPRPMTVIDLFRYPTIEALARACSGTAAGPAIDAAQQRARRQRAVLQRPRQPQ